MAKASNGLGKFSGKLGGAVFVIRNGNQIVREYNPRPSNPKSALQLQQRAKGNLSGRITKFVPKSAIMGLGVNAMRRRSRFNKILLDAAQVTMVGDDYRAKINWDGILFSEGTVIAPFFLSKLEASGSGNAVQVSLQGISTEAMSADVYASNTARLVVMVYDTRSQELVEVATKIITKPSQGGVSVTSVNVTHPSGYTAVCYLIPMSSEDGSEVAIDAGLALRDDTSIASLLSTNSNAVIFQYGRSVLLGQTSFNPS